MWSLAALSLYREWGGGNGDLHGDLRALIAAAHSAVGIAKRHESRLPSDNHELDLRCLQVAWRHASLGRSSQVAKLLVRAPHWHLPLPSHPLFAQKLEAKIN